MPLGLVPGARTKGQGWPLQEVHHCATHMVTNREKIGRIYTALTTKLLTGLLLLHPLKKDQNDAPGRDRVEKYCEIVTGLELAARHQRTLERAGSCPNSNRPPLVSDRSLFR